LCLVGDLNPPDKHTLRTFLVDLVSLEQDVSFLVKGCGSRVCSAALPPQRCQLDTCLLFGTCLCPRLTSLPCDLKACQRRAIG
jgi:hypothetical protein